MKFVIATGGFDDRSGGLIALHLLCQRLTEAGATALIWPLDRPKLQFWRNPRRYLGWLRYHVERHERRFNIGPFATKFATSRDIANAIVVYPEIVAGNPLGGRRVVRWLLNKPGFFTGEANYGADDLFFYFMQAFDDPRWNRYPDNELCVTWTHPAYVDKSYAERAGTCHMVRKGAGRGLSAPVGSIEIDGLSHDETAEMFDRSERFVCFDLYTRYTIYAALSGCLPIVVPQSGLSAEQWMPNIEDRYGVAYGEENISWALETRQLLRERLARQDARENGLLRHFIERCASHFD